MATFKKEQIPNIISTFRIMLVPLYVLLFFGIIPTVNPLLFSGIVFILAGISDLADGYLARKNHWITDTGKLLDPFADKLLELAVTICLAIHFRRAFLVLAGITIIKEAIMIVGAYIILRRGKYAVFSAWYGKAATFAWFLTVFLVSFFPSAEDNYLWCNIVCIVLISIMTFAFVMYVIQFWDVIIMTARELKKHPETEDSLTEENK